jgi:hypothetical protein
LTCDTTCANAGCSDTDDRIAIPGGQFARARCGDVYTICANGRQTTGTVRDRSETASSYEVGPGVQQALGVTGTFQGAIYRPGARQAAIDADPCCRTPQARPDAGTPTT